jgi:hypothetical protein
MKPLAAVALVAAAVATAALARPSLQRLPPGAPAGQVVLWGHVKTIKRVGARYQMRFDPGLWLTGITAAQAQKEDTGSSDVANDYYVREESHARLTYWVARDARCTVLARSLRTLTIPVSELAAIVAGKNPRHRLLFDRGNHLGYWIRVDIDIVRSLDQQYQP